MSNDRTHTRHFEAPTRAITAQLSFQENFDSRASRGGNDELFHLADWLEYFIDYGSRIWVRPKYDSEIVSLMKRLFAELGSIDSLDNFSHRDIVRQVESAMPQLLTSLRQIEQLDRAATDQFYRAVRYAFFQCIAQSRVREQFEYWLITTPNSPSTCMGRARKNPYTYALALQQNERHHDCDCTWSAVRR